MFLADTRTAHAAKVVFDGCDPDDVRFEIVNGPTPTTLSVVAGRPLDDGPAPPTKPLYNPTTLKLFGTEEGVVGSAVVAAPLACIAGVARELLRLGAAFGKRTRNELAAQASDPLLRETRIIVRGWVLKAHDRCEGSRRQCVCVCV